jgi:hypothetical protein
MQTMEEPFETSCSAANAGSDGPAGLVLYGRLNIHLPRRSFYESGRLLSASRCIAIQNRTSVPSATCEKPIDFRKNSPSNLKINKKVKGVARWLVRTKTIAAINRYIKNHTGQHWYF